MNVHETVTVPDSANIFFIGDVHGEYDMMMDALKLAGYEEGRDYVFCVGDLIDRGPKNLQVLAKFLYNPKFRSVRGNHDEFMIQDDYANWMYNGGSWTITEGFDTDTLKGIAEDMDSKMPYMMTVEHRGKRYGVVHAGIPLRYQAQGMGVTVPVWDDIVHEHESAPVLHRLGVMLWDRDVIQEVGFNLYRSGEKHPYFERYASFSMECSVDVPEIVGVDYVFHGHTGVPFPIRWKNRVYLDTGGTFNGRMTVASPVLGQLYTFTTDRDDPCGSADII